MNQTSSEWWWEEPAIGPGVLRDESRCVQCGACVGQCTTGALQVEPNTRRVRLRLEDCLGCEACVGACSWGALVSFAELRVRTGGA